MATFKKFNKDKRPKRNTQSLLFKRKRFCRFYRRRRRRDRLQGHRHAA
ncbi:ribosomal protein S15P/S13E [Variovorax sp. TBS-050B]|nr:ribosomal protein S15P/S13E [Variovorax sp. TBS-050B]